MSKSSARKRGGEDALESDSFLPPKSVRFASTRSYKGGGAASDDADSESVELEPERIRRGKAVDRSVLDSESSSEEGEEEDEARRRGGDGGTGGSDADSDEFTEPDEEDPADPTAVRERRKHAKLKLEYIPNQEFTTGLEASIDAVDSTPIVPFNLEADLEEGEFDEQGNFVWKGKNERDAGWFHDGWLVGVQEDVEGMCKAREAKERQQRLDRERRMDEEKVDVKECRQRLAMLMDGGGETVVQALRRYGSMVTSCAATAGASAVAGASRSKWAQRQQQRKALLRSGGAADAGSRKRKAGGLDFGLEASDEAPHESIGPLAVQEAKEKVDGITGLAQRLLEAGVSDVYDMTQRQLLLSSP